MGGGLGALPDERNLTNTSLESTDGWQMRFLLCLQCGFVPVGWSHANAMGGVLIGIQ